MKRFITYLYEYQDGKRIKNVGFLRIDVRGEKVNIEVCIKNYLRPDAVAKLYGLLKEDDVVAIEWGDIRLQGGQCNKRIVLEELINRGKKYSINDVVGVSAILEDGRYLASCWKDAYADEIAKCEISFSKKEILEDEGELSDILQAAEDTAEVEAVQRESISTLPTNCDVTYQKIEVEQIRELPSSNWYLSENSFLKHGVFNYGYVFLKKEKNEEDVRMWLGVPGFYEKQELLMAMLFGFPEFEPIPKTIVDMQMNVEKSFSNVEKNQEPKTGIFGGWFVLLNK